MRSYIFLYSEVMGYTVACLEALGELECQVYVVGWDKNKLVNFDFAKSGSINFLKRSSFLKGKNLITWVNRIDPDIIYVSGRMDKGYLKVARLYRKKGKIVVSGFDNQWLSSRKNILAVLFRKLLYQRYFSNIWVAGYEQYEYARRLGYEKSKILLNVYSCDQEKFNLVYERRKKTERLAKEKTLVYVGRFAEAKNIKLLIRVFMTLSVEERNGWNLLLIGEGPLKKELETDYARSPNIRFFDFMSPELLFREMHNWDAFILPSKKEAWGVVVHEFASAGYPLIVSDICGAGQFFVVPNFNGYVFKHDSSTDLKACMLRLFKNDEEALRLMGRESNLLSQFITPRKWAASFVTLLDA